MKQQEPPDWVIIALIIFACFFASLSIGVIRWAVADAEARRPAWEARQ